MLATSISTNRSSRILRGFTLIELLVMIAIISVIAVVTNGLQKGSAAAFKARQLQFHALGKQCQKLPTIEDVRLTANEVREDICDTEVVSKQVLANLNIDDGMSKSEFDSIIGLAASEGLLPTGAVPVYTGNTIDQSDLKDGIADSYLNRMAVRENIKEYTPYFKGKQAVMANLKSNRPNGSFISIELLVRILRLGKISEHNAKYALGQLYFLTGQRRSIPSPRR